jgi:hypothetical protein
MEWAKAVAQKNETRNGLQNGTSDGKPDIFIYVALRHPDMTLQTERALFFPISPNSCFVDLAESRAWLKAWAFFPPFIRHEMRRGRLEKASESLSRISHGSKINYT